MSDNEKVTATIQVQSVESSCNGEDSIPSSGTETPSTLVPTPVLDRKDDDGNTAKDVPPISAPEEKKDEKPKDEKSPDEEKDDPKKRRGWPSRSPFHCSSRESRTSENPDEKKIYWNELTWNQRIAWRKAFLREYLSEAKKCLPHVQRLFVMIYHISPWRAVVVLALNVVSGLLPALTLQTRGNFIMMVHSCFWFG